MKLIIQLIIFLQLISPVLAFAGPKDCTAYRIKLIRPYFIESIGLENAFKLLDTGNCVGALEQFERAAEMGNLAAQNNAGMFYDDGLGVPKDFLHAHQWYRKAAEGGLPESQYNLAAVILIPTNKININPFLPLPKPKNPEDLARYREALMWSIVADKNGHPTATDGVSRISDALPKNEIKAAKNAAQKWIKP
jgi:TPR repeat protein